MLDPNNIQPGYSPKPVASALTEMTDDSDSHSPEPPSDEPEGIALQVPEVKIPAAPTARADGIVSFT